MRGTPSPHFFKIFVLLKFEKTENQVNRKSGASEQPVSEKGGAKPQSHYRVVKWNLNVALLSKVMKTKIEGHWKYIDFHGLS